MTIPWTDADRQRAGAPVPAPPDPDPAGRAQAEVLLSDYLSEAVRVGGIFLKPTPAAETTSGQAVLIAAPALQIACVRTALDWSLHSAEESARTAFRGFDAVLGSREQPAMPAPEPSHGWQEISALDLLMARLYRRRLPYQDADIVYLLQRMAASSAGWRVLNYSFGYSLRGPLGSIERRAEARPLPDAARTALRQLRSNLAEAESHADGRAMLELMDRLLDQDEPSDASGESIETLVQALVDPDDDWGAAAAEALASMEPGARAGWLDLLQFAAGVKGTKPSGKWLKAARERVDAFGPDAFREQAMRCFGLLGTPTRNTTYRRPDGFNYPSAFVADRNAELLKGLAWCCATRDDERLAVALGDAALACYKKLPMIGARCAKAGNACVLALGEMPAPAATAQLQRLGERVKLPSAQKLINGALDTVAIRRGLTRAELDDLALPAFGLSAGRRSVTLGEYTAELAITGADTVELRWLKPDGSRQASVPAALKRDFAAELKELQQSAKEVRTALQTQRGQLERLLLAGRSWQLADWRAAYLDHGLRAPLARRLIWTFEGDGRTEAGIWLDGRIVGLDDRPLDRLRGDDVRVRLWHPIGVEASAVLAWREWLERHQQTQLFKQAHREVYLLTDAERVTGTYSNRFAGHILRQHQFQALCQQRGWSYRLQGAWDGYNTPARELPADDLRAEFVVEGVWDTEALDNRGLTAHGVSVWATTDQVRFTRLHSRAPVALAEIPPVVFSEVMRDVDLFVGVCSIGNDPAWPGREPGQVGDYWWRFAFGELSAPAETRADALARLLPRLSALEGRWSLAGRFLTVRGQLHEYRIHLGSGNVLMSPNDQYLCIVQGGNADNRGPGRIFLPFDEDPTLSLIVSKALLLAADDRITDPSITRQIRPS